MFFFHVQVLKWVKKKGNYSSENYWSRDIGECYTKYTSELCIGRPATGSDLGIEVSSPRHRRSTVIVCTTS